MDAHEQMRSLVESQSGELSKAKEAVADASPLVAEMEDKLHRAMLERDELQDEIDDRDETIEHLQQTLAEKDRKLHELGDIENKHNLVLSANEELRKEVARFKNIADNAESLMHKVIFEKKQLVDKVDTLQAEVD